MYKLSPRPCLFSTVTPARSEEFAVSSRQLFLTFLLAKPLQLANQNPSNGREGGCS